jgi:type II secretory pathway pseudopilin PulG
MAENGGIAQNKIMLSILLILVLALMPPLLTWLLSKRMERRAQERLRAAIAAAERRQLQQLLRRSNDHQYVEGIGSLIGDFTCRYNARSPYIRCAVNPSGPCESCRSYESNLQLS